MWNYIFIKFSDDLQILQYIYKYNFMNYNVNSKFNKNAKFKIQNSNKIDEQFKKKQIKSML